MQNAAVSLPAPPSNVTSIHALKSVLNTAGQHLGDLVWWTLTDATVDRAILEHLWLSAGLPKDMLPEPPSAEKALKGAVRSAQVGQPDWLIRLGKEDARELVFAILHEERFGDGSVAHHQHARVIHAAPPGRERQGRQVYLEGRLQTREWTDKEDQKHYTTEVVASHVLFLGGTGAKAAGAGAVGEQPGVAREEASEAS